MKRKARLNIELLCSDELVLVTHEWIHRPSYGQQSKGGSLGNTSLVFFVSWINVNVRVSLRVSRLILWALKLMTK